jgi:hypothetical protein
VEEAGSPDSELVGCMNRRQKRNKITEAGSMTRTCRTPCASLETTT